MKEALSLLPFGIGALCFVLFVTFFEPNAISAVRATSEPEYYNTEPSPAPTLPPVCRTVLA